MSDCPEFTAFCDSGGNAAAVAFLEELCDLEWSGKTRTDRITISDSHRHDACNYTHSGTVVIDGTEYGFVIDNGNWNGTVVREWGLAEDVGIYQPPKPAIYTFVPANDTLKEDALGLWLIYLSWHKEDWFQDKVRGYNYDRHFAPGGKTENYYRDWASKKGMKIVTQEEADLIIKRPKRDLLAIKTIAKAFSGDATGEAL